MCSDLLNCISITDATVNRSILYKGTQMKKLTGRRKAVQEHTRDYEACTEKIKIIPSADFHDIIIALLNVGLK